MLDPYRMVFVNIVAFLILIASFIVYRFIFKKKINLFFLLIIISILPLLSLLRAGDWESGDFNIHVHRIMTFYDSLMEGNVMPSWAAELNATYGIPVFIFNYSMPYYAVSFLYFLGFSFISSMKIYLGLSLFFSGIFMYWWVKEVTGNKISAFTAGIFYIFNPYHLIDIHFRATLGESTTFYMVPLFFLSIHKYLKSENPIFLPTIGLVTAILFLAHPLLAWTILGIGILYVLSFYYRVGRKALIFLSFSILAGILASSYSWISFIIYSPYTYGMPSISEISFSPFYQLFYSPWIFGLLFQGPKGELALILGYTQLLAVILAGFYLIRGALPKNIKLYQIFWLSMFSVFLFLMSPLSKPIWVLFPSFWMLVPTGRLLLPAAFITSMIAGYTAILLLRSRVKRILLYILLFITVGSTILNWGHRRVIPEIDDNILRESAWLSIQITPPFMNPKWVEAPDFWFPKKPDRHLEIIEGKGTFKMLKRTTSKHLYIVNAQTPVTVRENTLYFPGWSLRSNFQTIPIFPDERGIINAKLPQGLQYVELTYNDITSYRMIKLLSASSFIIIVAVLLFFKLRRQRTK